MSAPREARRHCACTLLRCCHLRPRFVMLVFPRIPVDMLLMLLPALRRITFYLAQTLMAIARHEEAYGWYEKRVALGGWHVSDRFRLYLTLRRRYACTVYGCASVSSVCMHWALPWLYIHRV